MANHFKWTNIFLTTNVLYQWTMCSLRGRNKKWLRHRIKLLSVSLSGSLVVSCFFFWIYISVPCKIRRLVFITLNILRLCGLCVLTNSIIIIFISFPFLWVLFRYLLKKSDYSVVLDNSVVQLNVIFWCHYRTQPKHRERQNGMSRLIWDGWQDKKS